MDKLPSFTEGDVRTYSENLPYWKQIFDYRLYKLSTVAVTSLDPINRNTCLVLDSMAKEVPGYLHCGCEHCCVCQHASGESHQHAEVYCSAYPWTASNICHRCSADNVGKCLGFFWPVKGSAEADIIPSSFRDAVQPFLFLMHKTRTREIAVTMKAQLLYLLKKCLGLVVTSIHLNAKANIGGHRGRGLNVQAMNWDNAKLQKW